MIDPAFGTRLLLLLLIQKVIDSDQAAQATESDPDVPERYLVERGIVNREQLATVVAKSFDAQTSDKELNYVAEMLPEEVQRSHNLFPIAGDEGDTTVVVAALVPGTSECTEELEKITGKSVRYVVIDRLTMQEHFDQLDNPSPRIEKEAEVPLVGESVTAAIPLTFQSSSESNEMVIDTEPGEFVEVIDGEPREESLDFWISNEDHVELPEEEHLELQEEEVPESFPEETPPEETSENVSTDSVENDDQDPPFEESTATVTSTKLRSSELLIGGRYRRTTKILKGRFSTLYAGKDERTGLPVAIRHLESFSHLNDALGGPDDDARAQTLREGRVLSTLNHPGLPRIRRLVQNGDDLYLVGDQITGRSLQAQVEEQGRVEPELVRRYLVQLLRVVDYLHTQTPAIIHRDLRAETVMTNPHGSLCLAEFGLAKMETSSAVKAATSFRSAGDPHFAAPEQLMGDASSPLNDLYSVGALAYYMACGKKPAESMKRFAGASVMEPLPSELQESVKTTIVQCLAPRSEERPLSAAELLQKLDFREVRIPEIANVSHLVLSAVDEQQIDAPYVTKKLPRPAPARKRSMWSLLFRKKQDEEVAPEPVPEDTAAIDRRLATIPFVDLRTISIQREVSQLLSETLSRTINGICLGAPTETDITVACVDPTDVHIYDQIAVATKGKFNPTLVRAEEDLIAHAIEFVYCSDHLGPDTPWTKFLELKRLHHVVLETTNKQAEVSFGDEALEGPIVEAVDRIVKQAIAAEASDIHLEPYEKGMDVRYRIDGVLRKVAYHERQEASAIVKRLKVMANMDIAQERVTQGGRISLTVGGAEFDLRVSIVPVPVGESVVMRILKKGAFTLTLSDLGFSEEKELRYRRILSQPHGMILVCGPTGSGKSTTLYASLKEIQRPDRKLLTAEDPIEYQMPGIIQVQMNTSPREDEKKVTFSKTLREFLRQDPDVILVGEIRDQETAEISIQAALTGHLLLSTLHTNDSVGIIARLRDMDCEPFQIGSVLLGGLAQRLARKICQDCRHEVPVPKEMLSRFQESAIENPKMFKGRGCRRCHNSGHRGRVGLYELLEITPEIRAHINRGDLEEKIRATAKAQGFRDLLTDGMNKVNQGLVTLEEVLRVCKTL